MNTYNNIYPKERVKKLKKKYMFVIPTLSNGGAERVVSILASGLATRGYDVSVLKYFTEKNEYEISDKVKIFNLSQGGKEEYSRVGFIKKIILIRRIIKKENPDIVIPFLFRVAFCVQIASFGFKVDVLQTIRNNPNMMSNCFMRYLRDYLVYHSKCTFVQNNEQKQYFKKKYHKKIHILYNPVPSKYFEYKRQKNRDSFTICASGRLEEQKNFKMLINAFSKSFKNDNVILQIYGKGSLEKSLKNQILTLNMDNQIKLMGRTNNMLEAYLESDMFVLSSNYEGMPNALIEAMACGLPCVSTDCPSGPSDLIENGINGMLVPVDDIDAMASALYEMYTYKNKDGLGVRAQNTIKEKCNIDNIINEFVRICDNLPG